MSWLEDSVSNLPGSWLHGCWHDGSGAVEFAVIPQWGDDMNAGNGDQPFRLTRYWPLYRALWSNSVAREMGFKTNFLLWIVVETLWFMLQLSFMGVMFLHTESIAGWSKWQAVLLIGTNQFIQQLFQAFFLTNCTQLSELVQTGRLDFMLLLPVNTRFLISLRQVDLGGFLNAALGLVVIGYSRNQLGIVPGPVQILTFGVLVLLGILIHYSLMFSLACVSFWTVKAQGIVWAYYNLFNIARMPDSAFKGRFKAFFTFVIPMLLVSNIPARSLIQKLNSPVECLALLGMGVACFLISEWIWRLSARRYSSASS